jgi:hypothetical protein
MTLVITFVGLVIGIGSLSYYLSSSGALMRFLFVCFGTTGRKSSETPCAYSENKR